MNQEKIGRLIAECRKEKRLTQSELAERLGVTDKSVSKWENGKCLPDVSLYKQLCEILGITLNEFFSGEKIQEENYKQVADNNLLNALEHSSFTLQDKIKFYQKKWEREHFFELMMVMILVAGFIIYGFIQNNDWQWIAMIIGFLSGIIESNRKMAYIESHAYQGNSNSEKEDIRKQSLAKGKK